MNLRKSLPKRLRECRMNLGLSQHQLAKKMRVPVQAINRYEKTERLPGPLLLVRFCRALNTSSDYLLGLSSEWFKIRHEAGLSTKRKP